MIRALIDGALAALLAPSCAVCGALLDRPLDGAACRTCWTRVARFSPPLCARCGDPLPAERTAASVGACCAVCSVDLGVIAAARALGPFEGTLADLIHACKYGSQAALYICVIPSAMTAAINTLAVPVTEISSIRIKLPLSFSAPI